MDATSIQKAKLLAAVICRVVDYHTMSTAAQNAPKGTSRETIMEGLASGERAVAVALENCIDQGALE